MSQKESDSEKNSAGDHFYENINWVIITITLGTFAIIVPAILGFLLPSIPQEAEYAVSGAGIGAVLTEIGSANEKRKSQRQMIMLQRQNKELKRIPLVQRQCYSWLLGFYSGQVCSYFDSNKDLDAERINQYARFLLIGEERFFKYVRNLPHTLEEANIKDKDDDWVNTTTDFIVDYLEPRLTSNREYAFFHAAHDLIMLIDDSNFQTELHDYLEEVRAANNPIITNDLLNTIDDYIKEFNAKSSDKTQTEDKIRDCVASVESKLEEWLLSV